MKKGSSKQLGVSAGLLLASSVGLTANTITLTQNPAYSYLDGGAFNAVTTENFAQYYSPLATLGGGFQTFCVEATVSFDGATPYFYNLSDMDSRGRVLTIGAAYLYTQFATGALTSFFSAADRSYESGLLQVAFWGLQFGQTLPNFPDYSGNPYYNMVLNQFGGLAGAETANNGAYNVQIVQMWDSESSHVAGVNDHQNQLVYLGQTVATPDSTSTAVALALGMASLCGLQYWFRLREPARVRVTVRR